MHPSITEIPRQKAGPQGERRAAPRLKLLVDAWADPGGVKPAIPCEVIDLSTTGAKIDCGAAALPDVFILALGPERHVAEVVWRRQTLVGVAFRKGVRSPRAGARLERG